MPNSRPARALITLLSTAVLLSTAAAAAVAATGLLAWAGGSPRAAIEAITAGPTFEAELVGAATLGGWLALGWLALACILECAARLPGAAGRASARLGAAVTPRFLQTLARALVAATLATGPLAASQGNAGLAFAADRATTTTASSTPALDRPTAPPPAPTPGAVSELDRPGRSYLPPPPPAAVRTDDGSTATITGTPQGAADGNADDGHVVRRGDTLWDIVARQLGPTATAADVARAWPAWYAANRGVIGPDPALLLPGELLHAPSG